MNKENLQGASLGASIRGVELTNVRVSLNPFPSDPWQRECAAWEIRSGFLVESLPAPPVLVPGLGHIGIIMLGAVVVGAGVIEVRRRSRLVA